MGDRKSILKRNIQQWLSLAEKYNNINKEINEIRKARTVLEEDIIESINELNLSNKTLMVNNSHIKMRQTKQFQTITLGYLKECLDGYFNDDEIVNNFMEYVKSTRTCKIKNELKII
tara:strand:- start:169 stop:519 length:351 start_codon:yes stop_codon:yes gene_type:complete